MDRMPINTIVSCSGTPAKPEMFSLALYAAFQSLHGKDIQRDQRAQSIGHLESLVFERLARREKGQNAPQRRRFLHQLFKVLREHEKMVQSFRAQPPQERVAARKPRPPTALICRPGSM